MSPLGKVLDVHSLSSYNDSVERELFPFHRPRNPGSGSQRLLHGNLVPPTAAQVLGLRSCTADGTRGVLHLPQTQNPFSTVPCCPGLCHLPLATVHTVTPALKSQCVAFIRASRQRDALDPHSLDAALVEGQGRAAAEPPPSVLGGGDGQTHFLHL